MNCESAPSQPSTPWRVITFVCRVMILSVWNGGLMSSLFSDREAPGVFSRGFLLRSSPHCGERGLKTRPTD